MLDIHTTIIIAAVLSLLTGVSLRYVLRDYPVSLGPSIRLWILGSLLQAAGWLLYGLPESGTGPLATVSANILLSFAVARQIDATNLFIGRPLNRYVSNAPVVTIALADLMLTYVMPDPRLRALSVSTVFAVQMLAAVIALLDTAPPRLRSHLLTASAFLTLAAILLLGVLTEGPNAQTPPSMPLASALARTAFFAAVPIFPIIATFGFVLMCTDRLHQELDHHARIDPLTGISNRRTLVELAESAIAMAHEHRRGLALLVVDADHFKHINDRFGHEVGDDALRLLALTLDCALRSEDVLGRLGGEEFVVALQDVDESSARQLAERLRLAVENTVFMAGEQRVQLQISIGFALREAKDDFPSLLRRADKAMYVAKRLGRNRVVGPADLDPASEPLGNGAPC